MHHLYISDTDGSFKASKPIKIEAANIGHLFELIYKAHTEGKLTQHFFID